MKVLGAGLGRTGTFSLLHALEMIDYTSTHFITFSSYPQLGIEVGDVFEALDFMHPMREDSIERLSSEPELKELMDKLVNDTVSLGFSATQDGPWSDFTYECFKRFPDAKVILSTRDSKKWAESVLTMRQLAPPMQYFPWNKMYMFRMIERVQAYFLQPHCGLKIERKNGKFYIPVYEKCEKISRDKKIENLVKHKEWHENRIRELIPKENLLEWTVTDGWTPICDFLEVRERGIKCPSDEGIPFPRMNDSAHILQIKAFFWSVVYFWPVFLAAVLYFVYRKVLKFPSRVSKMKTE